MEQKFSYFKAPLNVEGKKPDRSVTLEEVDQIIRSTEFKKVTSEYRKFLKTNPTKKQINTRKVRDFDFVTFHAVLKLKSDNGLDTLSGLFVADLDNVGDVAAIFDELVADKEMQPALIFISPSGDGLKVVYNIPADGVDLNASSRRMGRIRNSIQAHYAANHPLLKIKPDNSGTDVSRACFIPHDPGAYFNPDAEEIKLIDKKEKAEPRTPPTIEDIRNKHLQPENNRYDAILSFIGAVKRHGFTEQQTVDYINNRVHIDPESSASGSVEEMVKDQYARYEYNDKRLVIIKPDEFGIGYFKYTKKTGNAPFLISGLYHVGILDLLVNLGYAKFMLPNKHSIFVHRDGCLLDEVNVEQMRDAVREKIKSFPSITFQHLGNERFEMGSTLLEIFLTHHKDIFVDKYLQNLPILEDNRLKDCAYFTHFVFKNGIVSVPGTWAHNNDTKKLEIIDPVPSLTTWADLRNANFFVWKSKLIERDFEYFSKNKDCNLSKFLKNVSNQDQKRYDGLRSLMGYLMNKHFVKSKGQAGILNDEEISDGTPQGRTGKGVIVNAVGQVKTVTKISGKHFRVADPFKFSSVTLDTDIIWLDDVKANFDLDALFSDLTDGLTIEGKGTNMYVMAPTDTPKFIINSNSAIGGRSISEIGRQYAFELNNHYSKKIIRGTEQPISEEHGGDLFGDQWDHEEWSKTYSFLVDCAGYYLVYGVQVPDTINMERNRLIKAAGIDFLEWAESTAFVFSPARNDLPDLMKSYTDQCGKPFADFAQKNFTDFLKKYAAFEGWQVESAHSGGKKQLVFFGSYKTRKTQVVENEQLEELPF